MKIKTVFTTASVLLLTMVVAQMSWTQSSNQQPSGESELRGRLGTYYALMCEFDSAERRKHRPVNAPLTGSVLNGRAVRLVKPKYPKAARKSHAEGLVVVQVLIDEHGRVIAARAVKGDPLLQDVSVEAARNSLFSPTMLAGQPVKVTGVIQYNFVAQ